MSDMVHEEASKVFSLLFTNALDTHCQKELSEGSVLCARLKEHSQYFDKKYRWQCSDREPTAQVDFIVKRYREQLEIYKAFCILDAREVEAEIQAHRELLNAIRERIQTRQRKAQEELSIALFGNRNAELSSIVSQAFRDVRVIDPRVPPSYG